MANRSLGRRIARFFLWLALLWFGATILTVLALRWIAPPTSAFMMHAHFEALATHDRSYQPRYAWVDYAHISPERRHRGDRRRGSALRRARRLRPQVDRRVDPPASARQAPARREHDQPAGRQEPVPVEGPELRAQGHRGVLHDPDRDALAQAAHPRDVPQHRGVRPRRVRRRHCQPGILRHSLPRA